MMGRVGLTLSIFFFFTMTGCVVAALECYSCSTTQINSVCGRRATETDLSTCEETEFCYAEVVTVGSVPIWLERGCSRSCATTDTCRSSGDGTGVCRDCCRRDGCNGGVPNTDWAGPSGHAVTSCGGTYLEDSGTISTPGYPDNYPDNQNCEFLFPDTGQIITITFKDFHLEGRDWLSRCHDSIMVYAQNKLVDEYCGDEDPGTITSYGVRLVFMSDYSVSKTGFTLSYSRVNP
ncbi:tolloid-like protein 2 [Branchiostoma lanceolatum]|uniref:tolloid-like protein 2 n=1 Tax=Branchiostoma lanceolatum TaxID=7740 RepID=UPI00345275D5